MSKADEEMEAIKTLADLKERKFYTYAFDNGTVVLDDDEIEDIDIILNLIKNQQKEIKNLKFKNEVYKKKAKIDEKVIDEMAYQLAGLAIWDNQKEEAFVLGDVEEVKQYFYGKVENENV